MRKIFLLAFIICTVLLKADAQSWQWGKRGGSTSNFSGTLYDENVVDMATDKNGNLYVLSTTISSSPDPVTVGNASVKTFEDSNHYHNLDALLTSFNCNGSVRWIKAVSGSSGVVPTSLRVDTMGHVYMLGRLGFVQSGIYGQVPIHFSNDTTLPFDLAKCVFLAQYDTSGHFKWLRMPQSDTIASVTTAYQARAFDIEVDNNGNLNMLVFMRPGTIGGSNLTIPTEGTYILKYSPQGTLLSVTAPPIYIKGYATQSSNTITDFMSVRLSCTKTGKWIFAGTQYVMTPMVLNGDTLKSEGFVVCYDSQWKQLWRYINDSMGVATDLSNGVYGRVATDNDENLYIGGYTRNGNTLFGYATNNPADGIPFVAKLNINGARLWVNYATDNHTTTQPIISAGSSVSALALRSDGSVMTTGSCGGLKWGNFQIPGRANSGLSIFISRHDPQTGAILQLDTIKRYPGYYSYSHAMASDRKGNIFIGGQVDGYFVTGPDTVYNSGGTTDFFVAKYGFGCCTTTPTSSFNSTSTGVNTVQFIYTGTTTSIDSLVWNFGDGQNQKVTANYTTPVFHAYANSSHYTACASIYSSCGIIQSCKGALGVGSLSALGSIKVYPNPSKDNLTIEGAANTTAIITNTLGQKAMQFKVVSEKQVIDIASLPIGIYILQLTDSKGNRQSMSLSKQ